MMPRPLFILSLVLRFGLGALLIGSSLLDWREGSVFAVIIGVLAIGSGVFQLVRRVPTPPPAA